MALTFRPASTVQIQPRSSNSRAPRLRIALSLLFLLACLTSTVLASTETSSNSLRHRHHKPSIHRYELHRRKESDEDEEKEEIITSIIPSRTASGSKPTTVTIQRAAKTAASTSTPLPEAFDGNLAAELQTSSDSNCPAFLKSVLSDPSYETCYPLSMMLQVSR